ncbi:MAG: winged helix-turn-helix domain-containing protein [Patescibacteria group bacterium]
MKTPKQLERYFKGVANHRRLEIIFLIKKHKDLTVGDIAEKLKVNFKTISQHSQRLVQAGLLNKTYRGLEVIHSLSPYGHKFCQFAQQF